MSEFVRLAVLLDLPLILNTNPKSTVEGADEFLRSLQQGRPRRSIGLALSAQAAELRNRIDVKQLSKKVEDVVVPLPNEVFGALNKLGGVNWKEYVRNDKGSNFTERPRIALLLGAVIADGFIAVQAEDAPTVKEIGQRVLNLAKGIGVGNSITPHAKAITEAADKRKWDSVRQELDRTQNSVQQAMNEVHDEKLSQLVSLGGWLRGTEVLTAVVNKRFSEDGAELLHQPDLLSYFRRPPASHARIQSEAAAGYSVSARRGAAAD